MGFNQVYVFWKQVYMACVAVCKLFNEVSMISSRLMDSDWLVPMMLGMFLLCVSSKSSGFNINSTSYF